jgi:pre-mycofactocin synthase
MASTREWFETVAEAQRRARKRMPRSVYLALVAGTEQGHTLRDNVDAFGELGFRPRIADLPQKRSQTTTIMGQEIDLPVLISLTGVQAVHPEGEVAVARAAAVAGTAMGLSSFASRSIEDVAAVNPKTFFQTYWVGGRDAIAHRAERARTAGAAGLIITWTGRSRPAGTGAALRSRRRWISRRCCASPPRPSPARATSTSGRARAPCPI